MAKGIVKYPSVIVDLTNKRMYVDDGDEGSTRVTAEWFDLGNISNVYNNYSATSAPTSGDDSESGYSAGSRWVDTSANKLYICGDATEGAAVWYNMQYSVSDHGALTSLTSNAGHNQYKNDIVYVATTSGTNVKGTTAMADYVCDGVDDGEEIQQAIDAVAAVGGGIVHLLPGTYDLYTTQIALSSNVTLEGEKRATLLKLRSNFDPGSDTAAITNSDIVSGNDHITVRHLNFDCGYSRGVANITTIKFIGVSNAVVQDIDMTDSSSYGVYFDGCAKSSVLSNYIHGGYGTPIALLSDSNNSTIAYNVVTTHSSTSAQGIKVLECDHVNVEYNIVANQGDNAIALVNVNYCVIEGNSLYGCTGEAIDLVGEIAVSGETEAYYNVISNNFCSTSLVGIRVHKDAYYTVVTGNECYANKYAGIKVDGGGHYTHIVNNRVEANSQYADSVAPNIDLSETTYTAVAYNVIREGDLTYTASYAIETDVSTNYCSFFGNDLRGTDPTKDIHDQGANNVWHMNVSTNSFLTSKWRYLTDGVTAPDAVEGYAAIYVDSTSGDLKIKFGDGHVATFADS